MIIVNIIAVVISIPEKRLRIVKIGYRFSHISACMFYEINRVYFIIILEEELQMNIPKVCSLIYLMDKSGKQDEHYYSYLYEYLYED